MSHELVDDLKAKKALELAWAKIDSEPSISEPPNSRIEKIINSKHVTFKYILVTGYLAKCINPRVHARALQASSSLSGAYDARSLCHGVVVGFEKEKGNLFGLSNEPFVNKPARHPEHNGKNPQLRDTALAIALHEALEYTQTARQSDVFHGLIHILRLGKANADSVIHVKHQVEISLNAVMSFMKQFLSEADGGARLVAVWGGLTHLLSERNRIIVHPPNNSDKYSKTVGDVEVYDGDKLVSAAECKQRPINLDDVKHGIRKAEENGLSEYTFVFSDGVEVGDVGPIHAFIAEKATAIDVVWVNIWDELQIVASLLNPSRRPLFGEIVVSRLRDMRKFESANCAAELWNSLSSAKLT